MSAPAPDTALAKVNVTGPFPPFPASEVQSSVSPAVKPEPVQLQGVAVQTTEAILLAPAKLAVTLAPPVEVTPTLAARTVPSAPSWDHFTVSLSPWPATLATTLRHSPHPGTPANTT